MKGLTAKVFRTYNASHTFEEQLAIYTPKSGTVQEKLNAYNKANRLVAILCNHQRSVPKTHSASMEKMGDKVYWHKYLHLHESNSQTNSCAAEGHRLRTNETAARSDRYGAQV